MDAVRQYIEGRSFATVVTDEYFDHKSLILLGSMGLLRKLSMTPALLLLRDIKFREFLRFGDVFYV